MKMSKLEIELCKTYATLYVNIKSNHMAHYLYQEADICYQKYMENPCFDTKHFIKASIDLYFIARRYQKYYEL